MGGEVRSLIWKRREKSRDSDKNGISGKMLKGGQEVGRKLNVGQQHRGRRMKGKSEGVEISM